MIPLDSPIWKELDSSGSDTYEVFHDLREGKGDFREDMEFLGMKIDAKINSTAPRGSFADVSAKDSKVAILVIPTNEELVIARETKEIVQAL